jgi:putative oxidoreductase
MKSFPFISEATALNLFRIITSLLLVAHGCIRLYAGIVTDFGQYLDSKGFIIGPAIAWFLTIFEIVGGLLMAAGFLRKWIAAVFVIELMMGIILVHATNGWFVVGYQSGGVEYSVLLIVSLLLIAVTGNKSSKQ